jgi:hypothetical protein
LRDALKRVTAGLDPGAIVLRKIRSKKVDCRVKPGNDEETVSSMRGIA